MISLSDTITNMFYLRYLNVLTLLIDFLETGWYPLPVLINVIRCLVVNNIVILGYYPLDLDS